MKRKTFTKLKANLLTIDDLYSLVKTTCERTIILSSLYYDNLYKQYVEMRANNEKMCLQASIPARNELTEQLNEMNVARNVCFESIKREIYFNLNHRNKPGRLAAHELHHFFEPYWKSPIENPNIQSEIFHNRLTKYLASPDLMANVSILGLEMLLSNLESTNSRYDSLVKARSMEIDARGLMGKELKHLVVHD